MEFGNILKLEWNRNQCKEKSRLLRCANVHIRILEMFHPDKNIYGCMQQFINDFWHSLFHSASFSSLALQVVATSMLMGCYLFLQSIPKPKLLQLTQKTLIRTRGAQYIDMEILISKNGNIDIDIDIDKRTFE